MDSLAGKVVLVTGASRGIGASVVRMVAERGADVVINYRSKGPRAQVVADAVLATGRQAVLAQADITDAAAVQALVAEVAAHFPQLDVLVLNASGGLEKNKSADYAMQLNQVAQDRLVEAFLPLLSDGGRIVFITSHLAHFYGQKPVYAGYETVAASKHAGEQSLRVRIPALAERGITLVVVSGDLIEGTITPKLMARTQPGLIEYRREQAGALPTVEEFAQAIAAACADPTLASGATVYIGSIE